MGKSSPVTSKNPQPVATTGQLSSATSISDISFLSFAALKKAKIALAMKSVTLRISARAIKELPQLMRYIFPDSQ